MNKGPIVNIEAEQSILGCLLLDNDIINETVKHLEPIDFHLPSHQKIYGIIVDLYIAKLPVDVITVYNKNVEMEYLLKLTDTVPTTANFKHYINIVKSKSIRRKYIQAAEKVMNLAYEGQYDNIIDFKNDVQQHMDIEIKDCKKESSQISDIVDSYDKYLEQKLNEVNTCNKSYGLKWLDSNTGGAKNSQVTIVAARPATGKSAFAGQILLNLAKHNQHIAFFNLEMNKEQITQRLIANLAKIDMKKLDNPKLMQDEDWKRLKETRKYLKSLPIQIFDDVYKMEEIRAICRELKNKNQLDFVVIDYLQLCETIKKCNSELERISHLTRQIKLLGKEMNIPIWLLSQLTRANEHDNRMPKLIDLRSSGSIEQDADNVIFLHNPNYGKYTSTTEEHLDIDIIIAKQRQGRGDICGTLQFYKRTQLFCEKCPF